MATIVVYNGVRMYNVMTRKWDQEVVYDDTRTDPIANKFSLEFEGTIHAQSITQSEGLDISPKTFVGIPGAPVRGTTTATSVYQVAAKRLSEARKALTVHFDGHLALGVTPAIDSNAATMDVANGPIPISVNLVRIVGSSAFTVRFSIETSVLLCRSSAYPSATTREGSQSIALSNRWRIHESLDANFFTTRTIEGTLKVARTVTTIDRGDPGHLFKSLVVPSLEAGFRRDRIEFAVEPDNLTCTYSVVDKQVHHAAPHPATKMDVTHSESTADGQTYYSTVNVRLEGPPHADKNEMLARMIEIADRKIGVTKTDNTMIENLEIIDHIGEFNAVEANFRIRHIQNDSRETITKLQVKTWGKPLEFDTIPVITDDDDDDDRKGVVYSPLLNPVPYIYGYGTQSGLRNTATLFFLHCYLQDPCVPIHNIGQYDQPTSLTNLPRNERGEPIINQKSPGELSSSPLDSISNEASQVGMYTFSSIRNQYVSEKMRVQMPISKLVQSNLGTLKQTAVLLDLAETQMCRIVDVEMERVGSPPRLPNPVERYRFGTGNRGLAVLKATTVVPMAPILSPDSSQLIYRARATYHYMMDRPLLANEEMRIERNPFIAPGFAPLTKTVSDYFASV